MKTLILLRHAKSGDTAFIGRDFDRRLNPKGRRAAATIGRFLEEEGVEFDAVVASPAARVRETLEEVGETLTAELSPRFATELYLASAEDLLDAVRQTPDTVRRLLLVGHNPGLEQLVLLLVPAAAGDRARDEVEDKYPTGALAEIALDVTHWAEAAPGRGRLTRFTRPRDLDPTLGPNTSE